MWQLAVYVCSDRKEPHSECWLLWNLTVCAGESRFRHRGLGLLGNLRVHTFHQAFCQRSAFPTYSPSSRPAFPPRTSQSARILKTCMQPPKRFSPRLQSITAARSAHSQNRGLKSDFRAILKERIRLIAVPLCLKRRGRQRRNVWKAQKKNLLNFSTAALCLVETLFNGTQLGTGI